MSDASVAAALRSTAGLVVVEAPAGCGKTFQAASFAGDCAVGLRPGRMLILTHTHAASDVIARRCGNSVDVTIRTIDSLIIEIATAYHKAIDLPLDVSSWARRNKDGFDLVGGRVAGLVARASSIASALADRYPVVLCDEHQDASPHQHGLVMAMRRAGSRLRVFGDPMQTIYGKKEEFEQAAKQWTELAKSADAVEFLDVGHRWKETEPELGEWILAARATLRKGEKIDLRGKLPKGLTVLRADNRSARFGAYLLDSIQRKPIDSFIDGDAPLLALAAQNPTVASLRGVFNRRLPIWEGHTRSALDVLVRDVAGLSGKPRELSASLAAFLGEVTVGFSASAYGKPFVNEVETGCAKARRGKPAEIQNLARLILAEPNHKGVGAVLKALGKLVAEDGRFGDIKIDFPREYREAMQLAGFDDMEAGHGEIARRRSFLRPAPAVKSLSTVHKAKGLECERVLVLPCDKAHFGEKPHHRCLLYVALSRPTRRLGVVVPNDIPTPLFTI